MHLKLRLLLVFFLASVFAFGQQAQSWTGADKLALAYFFYWYNIHTGVNLTNADGSSSLTLHTPDSYLSTFAWTDVPFYQHEFSDMVAAGIDVALPVFWDPAVSGNVWSVPGLQTMVQALQTMAQAGQAAPKIGMFEDIQSIEIANGGAPVDLTSAAGQSQLYGVIHNFFAIVPQQYWAMIDGRPILVTYSSNFATAWNQSTFDYISQHFQQDFGTTPYIIRHNSFTGVQTDAAYIGWPAWYNPSFVGDVASLAPGIDNEAVSGADAEGQLRVIDRNCGDPYQQNWNEIISHDARLVLIETWNEFLEGEAIAATEEYGRRYIDSTAKSIAQWKATSSAAPYSPDTVWASLGPQSYYSGLYTPLNDGAATWLATRVAGHDAVYTDRSSPPPSYQIFLATDTRFLTATPPPCG